ncbi:MAG: M56 family metallopeptidase, partial [candidate division Zixibacteria bacterium]|nr:M56 family metallopeptidase [candidate division Zixibacteria bacterium]
PKMISNGYQNLLMTKGERSKAMIEILISMGIKSVLFFGLIYLVNLIFIKSPANRNFVFRLSFISLLILPLLSVCIPSFQISQLNFLSTINETINPILINQDVSAKIENNVSYGFNWAQLLIIIWISGFIMVILRSIIGESISSYIKNRSFPVSSDKISEIANSISKEIHLSRKFKIYYSKHISVPFVTGLKNYRIILPQKAVDWPDDKIEMVLTHEFAHIKRKDTFWIIISSLVSALYWYNPLVWVCRKKMIIDAEIVCDNYVLQNGANAQSYAKYLLNIARNLKYNFLVSPVNVNMARKTQLEGRLMSILSKQNRILTVKNSVMKFSLIATFVLILPLSGIQLMAGDDSSQVVTKEKPINTLEKQKNEISKTNFPSPDDFVAVDVMPEMIKQLKPDYPEKLKKEGIEGSVWITALVDTDGSVKKAMAMKSSGFDVLDKSAIKAAYGCEFKPAMQDNISIPVWVTYKVEFVLSDEKDNND